MIQLLSSSLSQGALGSSASNGEKLCLLETPSHARYFSVYRYFLKHHEHFRLLFTHHDSYLKLLPLADCHLARPCVYPMLVEVIWSGQMAGRICSLCHPSSSLPCHQLKKNNSFGLDKKQSGSPAIL